MSKNQEQKVIYLQGDTPKRRFPINLNDKIQVRYEMLRQASLSKKPIKYICKKFNYSKDMYYYYKNKFEKDGVLGLITEKTGPKQPTKRTKDLEKRVLQLRFNHPEYNMYDIYDELIAEGFEVSTRTVARVIKDHGLSKKKRKKEPY